MGGELELAVHPTEALLVTFAGSYVEAEFDSTVTDTVMGPWWTASRTATASRPCPTGNSPQWRRTPSRVSCSPRKVTSPPPGNSSASDHPIRRPGQHTVPIRRFLIDPMGTDMALNFRDRMELDAYHLFNLNAGMVYDSWEVMLYIKNIADENPQLSFDRERGGAPASPIA